MNDTLRNITSVITISCTQRTANSTHRPNKIEMKNKRKNETENKKDKAWQNERRQAGANNFSLSRGWRVKRHPRIHSYLCTCCSA